MALLSPGSALAQPVKVMPVEVGGLGGANSSATGARNTLAPTQAPGFTGFNNPNLTGSSFASPKIIVAGSNPTVAAAATADPKMTLAPSAAIAGQYSPRSRGAAIQPASEALAGSIPTAEDPARRTPEGSGGGLSTINGAVKDLDKAKKDERAGMQGAVAGRLDSLFDFSRGRSGEILPADGPARAAAISGAAVQGLPDPKVVGVEPALGKVRSLARVAGAAEAPALYGRAVEIAREGLPAAEAASRIASIKAEAAARAPAAVQSLSEKALSAAATGRTTDAAHYAKAVDGWDALLAAPGLPYIDNLRDLTATVKHVLKGALETPGRTAAAPAVRFEVVKAGGAASLRAKFKFAKAEDAPLTIVPQSLAAAFALPELAGFVALEGPTLPDGPGMAAAFAIRPQAGFSASYRAAVAQGRTSWSSFWMAARGVSVAAVLSVWDEIKAFLVHALQALGILRAAAPSGPAVEAPTPEALADLRLLMAERSERPAPPAAAPDSFGLGYRVVTGR